jgi:hypothetical protein
MRKVLIGLLVLALCAIGALADSYTYTVAATNGGTYQSDALPISGWLDKIEFSQDASATCTVTLCSYVGTNATAAETYMTLSATAADTDVVRPRVIGETTAGVALAAATTEAAYATNSLGQLTNMYTATTMLVAPYERTMIGGSVKVNVSGVNASDGTDNITVRIVYEPTAR